MDTLTKTYETITEILKEKKERKKYPLLVTELELYDRNKSKGIDVDRTKENLTVLCKANNVRFGRSLNFLYFYLPTKKS